MNQATTAVCAPVVAATLLGVSAPALQATQRWGGGHMHDIERISGSPYSPGTLLPCSVCCSGRGWSGWWRGGVPGRADLRRVNVPQQSLGVAVLLAMYVLVQYHPEASQIIQRPQLVVPEVDILIPYPPSITLSCQRATRPALCATAPQTVAMQTAWTGKVVISIVRRRRG